MADNFIPDNTKKQQIDKIFQVIDKNKDNKEICKIAFDTLNSKCLENPSIIFPILTNFIGIISKGNLRLVQEGNSILINFFQDLSFKELTKILLDNDIKKDILSLIKEGKTDYPLYVNPTTNSIEEIKNVPYMTMDFFTNDFDINKYAPLYKEDFNAINNKNTSNKSEELFSKREFDILFQNDPNLKNELFVTKNDKNKSGEMDIEEDINEINNKNKISVEELYKNNSKNFEMLLTNDDNDTDDFFSPSRKKMKKLDENSKELTIKINFFPFLGFMLEILKYDHMPYLDQRNCSITLLQLLEKQYDKIFYYPFEIKINYLSDFSDILNVVVLEGQNRKYDKFKEIMQMNMMTQLLYNSIIDKVLDTSNSSNDYICLFKDINLKVLSLIINNYKNGKLKKEFYQKTIMLLNIFMKDHIDWQPLFAMLTLYKYISFISDGINFVEFGLFDIINNIIDIENEEIRNLIIKILDKALSADMINSVKVSVVMKIFDKFIDLNGKYDDIDIGVKDYLNCLYNFTNYFKNRPQNRDIFFQKFQKIVTNEKFILYALNKMENVRIKFYEVINHLISDKFFFEKDILEKLILLAFQGLCFENNKEILNAQKEFLLNVLCTADNDTLNNAYNTFQNNYEIIFYLFLKENINDVKTLYYPPGITEQDAFSAVSELYKPFILNDIQVNEIKIKYEKKISNIIPIISLLIRIKPPFIELVFSNLDVHIPYSVTKEMNYIPLNQKLLLFMRIVLYYLLDIQQDVDKMLLLSGEVLQFFSELNNLNEMSIQIPDESIGKTLLNSINNLKKFGTEKIKYSCHNIDEVITNLKNRKLLLIKNLKNSMKEIYVQAQKNNDDKILKLCSDYIKNINDIVLRIEKKLNIPELRIKIRGYVSACLFMHSSFNGEKTNKISCITNSFLNCLKLNNKESDMFVFFLISFLRTVENKNAFNKIFFTFFENNIKMCQDWINNNKDEKSKDQGNIHTKENEEKDFVCYPMKYLFKKYKITYQKTIDIKSLIELYEQNLVEQKCVNIYEKFLILLFLIPSKFDIKIINQEKFIVLLNNIIPTLNTHEEYIQYLTKIIYCADNIFENYNLKKLLDFLFTQVNHDNVSIFKLLNAILEDDKISIMSIDYIFTVLNYINSPNEEIRKISTSIFSKQMKIISILKFSDNYSQITEKNSDAKSLQFISNIFNQNISDMKELNVKLKINLRNYQLIGINWLLFLGNYGLGLALCDDMGLGKSIQTLVAVAESTIEYKKKNGKAKPSLIICPNTLIMNWISEAKKFFDDNTVHIENNLDKLNKKNNYNTQTLIYICSYERARDNFSDIFDKANFYYLVLDEAHIIKNPRTKMYQTIKKINADKRVILTGTPIQNNVMELWALFNFLMPNFLGSSNDFEIKYHKKMAQNIKKLNLQEDVQENIFQTSLQEIRKRIKPFILRRLKSEVLKELPEKIISDYNCEMQPEQRQLYEKYNIMYNNNKLNTEKSALSVIDKLRKICNHPYLLDITEKKLVTKAEKEKMLEESGKLKALEELLISLGFESATKSNSLINSSSYENKLLIFTQMTKMCTYLEIFFKQKFPGLKTLTLTGDTKSKEKRGEIVDNFNNDPSINALILTINIGGVGLNLTSANVVIMYDHSWNPSRDMQAIDRAHRLGQKKIVQVFRLITINSIEEQLISLQTFKKYISNNVVDTSKIHEDKVNLNSVMQSFEEFSKDRINSMKEKNKKENKKMSKYEELMMNDEDEMKQELEFEYLKKFVDS